MVLQYHFSLDKSKEKAGVNFDLTPAFFEIFS